MIKLLKSIWRWFFPVKSKEIVPNLKATKKLKPWEVLYITRPFRKQQLIGALHHFIYNKKPILFRVIEKVKSRKSKRLTYKLESQ